MLQGHFVDTLLAPAYRDLNNPVFSAWSFMRGLTAPVFFTVTGIVFVFLLLKEHKPLREHVRVRKGIRRAFFLLALGYLLKWNVGYLLTLQFFPYHFTVDVLHVIGLALLLLIGVYAIHRLWGISYPLLSGLIGITIFLLFPVVEAYDWSSTPRGLANYFTIAYGSTFTVLPWLGYTMLGGVIGSIVHFHTAWFKKWWIFPLIFGVGMWLHFSSYTIFSNVHQMLGWDLSALWLEKQYLFWRFGHVLIVLSVFILLEQLLKRGFHPLFLKIGSETLTIYGAHYVILYGTWFGVGLAQLWKQQLDPFEAVLGVILFETFFILLIAHIEKVREVLYQDIPALTAYIFRLIRVKVLRNAHQLYVRYQAQLPFIARYLSIAAYRALALVFQILPVRELRKWGSQD